MNWYMANTTEDNEYGKFENDEDAIHGFLEWADGEDFSILKIYRCNDDECLSLAELVWH